MLVKDTGFVFDENCLKSLFVIKEKLITASVIIAPNWEIPFEIMCDARDYTVYAVLGQQHENCFHTIYYASNVLNENQVKLYHR